MSDAIMQAATTEVVKWEGFSATPYQDEGGKWTIGYGSIWDMTGAPVTATTPPVTMEGARALVARELAGCVLTLAEDVKMPLTPDEQLGFLDFIFNCGSGAFNGSTFLRLWNAGDRAGAIASMETWDHVNGVIVRGLFERRLDEAALLKQ